MRWSRSSRPTAARSPPTTTCSAETAPAWATIPASGRYFVQIQDANGRHPDGAIEGRTTREYLLTIGDVPLAVSAYPPGPAGAGSRGSTSWASTCPTASSARPRSRPMPPSAMRLLRVETPRGVANPLTVRLGDGPELVEPDPEGGNDPLRPMPAVVPGAINGRFSAMDEGDVDYYRLIPPPGREGDYAITVYAARIGSPADPVVSIVDPEGHVAGRGRRQARSRREDREADRRRRPHDRGPRGVRPGRASIRLPRRGRADRSRAGSRPRSTWEAGPCREAARSRCPSP